MSELTHGTLLDFLRYEPKTGYFFWLVNRSKRRMGQRAGHLHPAGKRGNPYWCIKLFGRTYPAARLAWFYITGKWPVEVDHKDTVSTNDRWDNLREATRQQNEINKGAYKNSKTGLKGVFPRGGKFQAQIMRHRRRVSLGTFDTADAAHAAYLRVAAAQDGEFLRVA